MSDSIKKAAKAGAAYTIGNVLLKGISFFTLPLFSRLLSTEEYGYFTVYVSYETIFTIFVGLCLFGCLRTGKFDYKNRFEEFVSSILWLSTLVFIGISVLVNVVYSFYTGCFDFDRGILLILLVHSYAMFIFQFYNTKLALEYKYKGYLIASGINAIGGTILSIILILFSTSHRYLSRIYGYAIVPIIVAGVIWSSFIYKARKQKIKLIQIDFWKYGLLISLPLVLHNLSQQILNQFDRIMINRMVDTASVGIYGFIHTIANILQVIVLSMDSAWSAWMYEQLDQKNYKSIKERSSAYVLLMNIFYIGFISLAPDVIKIFGPAEYHSGIQMIYPMSFAIYFIFLYSLPVHVEYFYKKTKYIALGTSLAAICNLVLNYVFILLYGYMAAAWTTMASYLLLFVFHLVIAHKLDNNSMFPKRMIIISLILLVFSTVLSMLFAQNMLIRWTIMIVVIAGMSVAWKDKMLPMINMVPILNKIMKRFNHE